MTDLQRAVLSDVSIPTGPGGTPELRGVLAIPEGSGP